MRHVRAMPVAGVLMGVTVSRYVMGHVFMYWSNMLAGVVSRSVSRR